MFTNIAYLGYNDFRVFKRGVENVIHSQSKSKILKNKYYIFFNHKNEIFHKDGIIHISIKNIIFIKYILLNILLYKLKKKKQIIIHSHNYLMSLFSIYTTNVFTVHDAIYYQRKSNSNSLYPIFYFIEKLVYIRCNKIHFISLYAKEQSLINSNQTNKAIIIYNTTPFEGILCKEKSIYKDSSTFNLFSVRGIQKRTRIDLLIELANYLKDKRISNKKIHIYVAGKGPLLDYYRKIIKEKSLENITLLGYVEDSMIANYYTYCDMVIMPCEYAEGFGLPIIEGYYYNKPVIASNKCAVPEIIISPKFLFENNPIDIYNTIVNTYNDSTNYQDYYYKNFSSEKNQNNFSKLYSDLIFPQKKIAI